MKVFLIGGVADSRPQSTAVLETFCRGVGQLLAASSHSANLCTCQPGSADRAVLEGLTNSRDGTKRGKLIVHRPDDGVIRDDWRQLRNEHVIGQGERIDERIERGIRQHCNLFVALWGREYVKSPYCFDELELWVRHRGYDNLYLLRFDATRPVWPCLRNLKGDGAAFRGNWPLVDTERRTLYGLVQGILNQFVGGGPSNPSKAAAPPARDSAAG